MDYDRIRAAGDAGAHDHKTTLAEERQELRRKEGELKKKIREQLARNPNQPILTDLL